MANENNDDKLIIEIELDDGKLVKGFVNAKTVAGKAGKEAGEDFGDGASKGALLGLGKLKSTLLGLTAVFAGAFTFGKMIDEAVEGERALIALNNSLRMSGEFTPQLSSRIQDFADDLARLTGGTGEAVLEQFALAKSLSATTEQAMLITSAAQGMGRALGIDASSAVMRISQTLSGAAGTLGRIVPELQGLTEEQLKSGAAIDIINKKFAQFAEDSTNYYTGAQQSFTNALMDNLQALGEIIVKSPVVVAIYKILGDKLRDLAGYLSELSSKDGLATMTDMVITLGRSINMYLILPLEQLYNVGKVVFLAMATGLQAILTAVAVTLGKMGELANFFGVDNSLTESLKIMSDSYVSVFEDMVTDTNTAFDQIFEYPFTAKTDEVISEIETVAQRVAEATASAAANSGQALRTSKAEVSQTTKEIAKMIENGLVRSVSTGIQAVGASFVQGSGAFKDFGNQIIGIMGDLAIQVGTAIVFTGQAIEVLRNSIIAAVGIPAIAAGIALIALGGALKAFASKNSSTATANSAVPQTGGESFGTNPQDQSVITNPETERERVPEININIQGDVLDSDESGRRIVDIINNAFDREGLKIRRGAIA